MPDNPITVPLPQDLPTDWTYGQTIGPNGTDVGLSEQHGYNYLMKQVNAAQQAAKETGEAIGQLSAAAIGAETPAGAQEKADAAKAAAIAASDPKGSAAAVSSGITGGTIKAASAAAADTAAKLTTKRTIALSGAVTGTATGFDGSGNITIPTTGLDMSKAKAGVLPVAFGGTGKGSLGDVTVGNADAIGGTPASEIGSYENFSGVDLVETIRSYPARSCGLFRNTGTCTNLPRPGYGGTGYFVKSNDEDCEIFWVSLIDGQVYYNELGGREERGWMPIRSLLWGGYSIWKGTQAQYNALSSKSSTTLYFIVG